MDEKNDQLAHRRIVAGRRGILRNHGRNNNSPETAVLFAQSARPSEIPGDALLRTIIQNCDSDDDGLTLRDGFRAAARKTNRYRLRACACIVSAAGENRRGEICRCH